MDTIIGHSKNVELLRKIIGTELPKVFIFSGPEGVGKRTLAIRFIREYCSSYPLKIQKKIVENKCLDVSLMNPGKQNYSVDQIKDLHNKCRSRPMELSHKFFILNDAQYTTRSFNDKCLTLFETPDTNVFFLITNNLELLPPTIKSRSFILNFGYLTKSEVNSYAATHKIGSLLVEETKNKISRLSRGSIGKFIEYLKNGVAANLQEIEEILENLESKTLQEILGINLLKDIEVYEREGAPKSSVLRDKTELVLNIISNYYTDKALASALKGDTLDLKPFNALQDLQKITFKNLLFEHHLKVLLLKLWEK